MQVKLNQDFREFRLLSRIPESKKFSHHLGVEPVRVQLLQDPPTTDSSVKRQRDRLHQRGLAGVIVTDQDVHARVGL
ncbi:hypothetical protein D3C85_1368100 [compost metagenome]